MPVRIYDIARKLGLENKDVLLKAKELGMTAAKVASSTLDKISAEYLVEKLGGCKPAPPPPPLAPPPESAPAPSAPPAPVVEPVRIVVELPPAPVAEAVPSVAVAPEIPVPPVAPAVAPAQPELAPLPPAPVEPPPAEAPAAPILVLPPPLPVVPETPPQPVPPVLEAVALAEPPSPVVPTVPPPTLELPAPPEPTAAPVVPVERAPEPRPVSIPIADRVPPAIAPVEIPLPPPPPPGPRIGDKVGFIQLAPARGRSPDRSPPAKAPSRPGPPKPEPPSRESKDRRGAGAAAPPTVAGPAPVRLAPAPVKPEGPKLPPLPPIPATSGEPITLKPPITVRDLAGPLNRKPFQLIANLMEIKVFATVNQVLEPDIATWLGAKQGRRLEFEKREKGGRIHRPLKPVEIDPEDRPEDLVTRAPVVTIMGHVDHGKTTLLDAIRKSNVAAGEAGGITQHIGAYTISFPHPNQPKTLQQITFLDTPGHAAFTAMRSRGAKVTDVVVLVVAANDGVMPQTLEALSHAQAAQVPIIVAVNKVDHPNANPARVRQQLQDKGVIPDDWGGDTIFVEVSALTKQGVDKLLEMILLQAEMLDLKANPKRKARGNVIESGLEPGGPTATVLVRKGTLRTGDTVTCGQYCGRVRALINEENKRLKEAGPSVAVKVLGIGGVPEPGWEFSVVENEKAARALCEEKLLQARSAETERRPKITLENLFVTLESESAKVLRLVVKADTQGSVEAIVEALRKIESTKVSLEIIHSAVGTVAESDVLLASASEAIVVGFHSRIDSGASELAKREGVQIRLYAIIYELIDQVKEAMAGLLDPLLKEEVFGVAEVRKVFALNKGGNVAGCVVASGRIVKGKARVMRRRNLVYEGLIQTLRRFQDEVNEVRSGMECGVRLDGFDEFEPGDTVECYTTVKVPQKL